MHNIKRAFILYVVIITAQFSTCAPSRLPLIRTFTQKCAINNHKKPILVVIITAIATGVSYINWKKNSKKKAIRKEIELELKVANTSFCHAIFNRFFKNKVWKMLWNVGNINLETVFHGNDQEIQKKLLARMVTALCSNSHLTLEVLIEKPFWGDKLIDPNIKLPLGNGESVNKQIQHGYCNDQVNFLQPQLWITPLQYIIVSDFTTEEKLKLINILLANGANPFGKDQKGNDALHYAVKYAIALNNPDIAITEYLIEAGAQADIPNNESTTCMHLVSNIENDQKRQTMAKILIKCKPDMNTIDEFGNTPLLNAVMHGRVELTELFLNDAHAAIDQTDSAGNSILMLAIKGKREEPNRNSNPYIKIINHVLNCPDIHKIIDLENKIGLRPITCAIYYKNHTCVNQIFNNINVNIIKETEIIFKDGGKKLSPIQLAFDRNNEKILSIFLKSNTIPVDFRTSNGNTLAHLIAGLRRETNSQNLINLAIAQNVPLNETNNADKTPLEIACSRNNTAVIAQLIEQPEEKIPKNTVYTEGNSLAHLVTKLDNENKAAKLMTTLADNNFPLNEKNSTGKTPLEIACSRNNTAVIEIFIQQPEKRISRDTVYTGDNSLAHLIPRLDNEDEAVKLMFALKENNFPLDQKNSRGQNILHIAIEYRHYKVAHWISNECYFLRTIPDNLDQIPPHYLGEQGNQKQFQNFHLTTQEQEMIDYRNKTPLQLLKKNNTLFSKILSAIGLRNSTLEN